MGRGALIVLEGCDRAGKSTQAKMLASALARLGLSTECRQFPNRQSTTGKMINEYLTCKKDLPPETVHLLFSANRWECSDEIKTALEAGTTIIVDRYAASGAAYGAANTGRDLAWCKEPDRGLPAPDLVAYLRVDEESQKSRDGWAGERFERKEFQESVASNYQKLTDNTWKVFGKSDIDTTHAKILAEVVKVLKDVEDQPIQKLYASKSTDTKV